MVHVSHSETIRCIELFLNGLRVPPGHQLNLEVLAKLGNMGTEVVPSFDLKTVVNGKKRVCYVLSNSFTQLDHAST